MILELPGTRLQMALSSATVNRAIAPLRRAALAVGLTLAVAACGPVTATRGNLVDNDRLQQIQVGQTNANDVFALLGTPTSVSTFDSQVWYYIGERTEQLAFLEPSITERRVLMIRFDEAGMVTELAELGADDAIDVTPVGRETPTLGRQITILEQLLGNVGRFTEGGP